MATDFHIRVRDVLEAALQRRTSMRDAFVRQVTRGDTALMREVRSLLPHYQRVTNAADGADAGWRLPGTTTFTQALACGEDDVDLQPPFSIAPYTVVEVIGRGGMGVVYRGIHPIRHSEVAIKVLRRRLLSVGDRIRFKHEEELLRQLRHPGIVKFLHGGVARLGIRSAEGVTSFEQRPYLVMEYVKGEPLTRYALIAELDPLARLGLLVTICDAVDYAHQRGIVHRDLKPDNILVDAAGCPRVLDFGIARVQGYDCAGRTPQFTCTPAYASPEQLAGNQRALTATADVFSLGIIACELLAGRLPRRTRAGVTLDFARAFRAAEPQFCARTEGFAYAMHAILAAALRKTRGQRYTSSGEFGRDLAELCRIYAPAQGWARFKARFSRLLRGGSNVSGADCRLLSAMMLKRVGMAMDRTIAADVEAAPTKRRG